MMKTDGTLESDVDQRSTYDVAFMPRRRRPRPTRPTRPFFSETGALARAVAA